MHKERAKSLEITAIQQYISNQNGKKKNIFSSFPSNNLNQLCPITITNRTNRIQLHTNKQAIWT
jgi:hypothetical protein